MHRAIWVAVAFVVGLAGAGMAGASPQTAPIVEVCSVLPAAEVARILDRSVRRARPTKRADAPATECDYFLGLATISVVVGANVPKPRWDESMNILRTSGATLTPAPGIGDGAFFWDDRLYAHTGNYEITVSTTPAPGADATRTRQDAVALAKAVIARITR